jgi:hypothetical protein
MKRRREGGRRREEGGMKEGWRRDDGGQRRDEGRTMSGNGWTRRVWVGGVGEEGGGQTCRRPLVVFQVFLQLALPPNDLKTTKPKEDEEVPT